MGTPQRGSDLAGLLHNVLSIPGMGAREYLKDLATDSKVLIQLNAEFRQKAHQLLIYSFCETHNTDFGVTSDVVVPETTLCWVFFPLSVAKYEANGNTDRHPPGPGFQNERIQYMIATHRDMVKFSDPDDPNYLRLRDALYEAVKLISQDGKSTTKP